MQYIDEYNKHWWRRRWFTIVGKGGGRSAKVKKWGFVK